MNGSGFRRSTCETALSWTVRDVHTRCACTLVSRENASTADMVENIYPAVKWADAILLLCPNYNDALSANMTAFINRLTALFRTTRFYDKALFGIIVSGYSGSDLLAGQLVTALNMNKTFYLPGNFCMMETANNAGAAMKLPGIEDRIKEFSEKMTHILIKETQNS